MKPMQIDFAPNSWQRSLRQSHPLTWVVLALALTLCSSVFFSAQKLHLLQQEQQQLLERKQSQLTQRSPAKLVAPRAPTPEAQIQAVNQAILQLNLPWRDLLNGLEAGTPKTIALLALEPDAKKFSLKGLAEARDSDAMIEFISQMKKQAIFDDVLLSKHEINEQDPNKPLRFQFEARWTGVQP